MAVKIVTIAAGHAGFGVTPGKRGPDGKFEWYWNNQVVLAFIERMKQYKDVKVIRVDDPTGRVDVSLNNRTQRANAAGADLHIDVHHNALGTKWFDTGAGIETYVMSGSSSDSGAMKAAREIHKRIVPAMGLKDRGIKQAAFFMLKYTKMPAVLTEGGFMDSRVDRRAMDDPAKCKAQGYGAADGAAAFLGRVLESGPVIVPAGVKRSYYLKGDKGAEIIELQQDLNEAGFKIAIDGIFGDDTRTAVIAFQKKYGLDADGVFGVKSQSKLQSILKSSAVLPVEWFRVRKSWADTKSQLGAFGDLEGAKEVADLNPGYEVYDDKGRVVYPLPKATIILPKGAEAMDLAKWQREEIAGIFKKAREKGIFEEATHEKAILDGTMPRSQYEYLIGVIAGAGINGGKRIK